MSGAHSVVSHWHIAVPSGGDLHAFSKVERVEDQHSLDQQA